jgi:WD40 repeat protein
VFLQPFTKSNAVAFAPRGDRIAIAGSTTQIVDLTTGKAVADITTGAEGTSLAYSADGARLVVGAADGSVILADAANGQALLKYQLHDRRVVAVRVDAQARRILSVGADSSGAGNGTVVDVVSQQPLTIVPNETAVLDAAMSSGDTATATMAYADGSIRTVDLTPSADRVSLSAGIGINRTVLLNHAEKAAVFNVVSILPSLAVFDASTGAELSKRRVTYSIADISRDGRFIAARERAGLKILDASDERQILSFDHGSPTRIYFSWDGLRVFTVNDDDKKVRVVQTLTGAILKEVLVDAFAEEPTFAPDGRRVAFAAGRRVHLLGFDGSGDAEIRRNETSGPVSFSADSAVLFVGDGITLRLVDVLRGNDRRSVPLQTTVLRLATSPDEAWIAAACSDGTVRLIDATTGQIVSQIEAPGEIQALAFDRTGRSIRIAQQQSIGIVLRTFPVALDDLVSETCARLSRNLTESEWRQYLAGEPYRPTCTLPEVVTVHTSRQ